MNEIAELSFLQSLLFTSPLHLLLLLPFFILLFFLWTFIHESCHAVMALLFGNEIISFKPYPHKYNGSFYFGRVSFIQKDPILSSSKNIWISSAPYIFDLLFFIGCSIGVIFSTNLLQVILLLFLFAPLINSGNAARLAILKRTRTDLYWDAYKQWTTPISIISILYLGAVLTLVLSVIL